jgi:hypothetical protein
MRHFPEERGDEAKKLLAVVGHDIPMVPMMEVRRKFFAGTISVLSLECHSSFIRLDRWSREEVAAIVNVLDKANGGSSEGRGEMENQLKKMRWRRGRGEENGSRMEGEGREGKMLVADAISAHCFFSSTQTRTGLAPGYSPVYTAPTLLL